MLLSSKQSKLTNLGMSATIVGVNSNIIFIWKLTDIVLNFDIIN